MPKDESQGYKPIQVRVDPATHRWLKEEAVKQERSMNWLLNRLIGEAAAKAQQPRGVQQ